MRTKAFAAILALSIMSLPAAAEKVAAYLLQMSSSSRSEWVVTNTYSKSVNFLLTTQDGDAYWGVVAPGGTNESTINSGKDYHIYPCAFPGYAVDDNTAKAPTFSTQNWHCSQ